MWKRSSFNMTSFLNRKGFSIIEGVWKAGGGIHITIANVYSSGTLKEKKEVWEELRKIREIRQNKVWWCCRGF